MIRVLVAEDSLTVRELLVQILESDPELRVVGQAKNGVEAVEMALRLRPELITMDVHMPLLDGLEATKEIMARAPTPIIIVSSSTSGRDVELSMSAMRAGALMVVAKPDDPRSPHFNGRQGQLLSMAKSLSRVKVVRRWADRLPTTSPVSISRGLGARVRLVTIASSTGGPAALHSILHALPGDYPVPVLVVQHIAAGFLSGLVDWLNANCDLRVKIAKDGERALSRTVYLAPDGQHLGVALDGTLSVTNSPPIDGFRPSGTVLFEAAARAYGPGLAAVILTGMGRDGVAGLAAVKAAGGLVAAQDEESSVVFGMPREAIAAGLVDAVLPLDQVAPFLVGLTTGRMQ